VDWFQDHVLGLSAGAWTALAAWLAVVVGVAALVYAWRQYQRAREQAAEAMQPQVAMFMEPSASDWHLVELVVKNFGRTPAYGIRFDFANPPTVGRYERAYEDDYVDITPLNLPAEIPYLAPTQEWLGAMTAALLATLAEEKLVVATSISDVGLVETALAVRASDPKLVARDEAELREALLASDAIFVPDTSASTRADRS